MAFRLIKKLNTDHSTSELHRSGSKSIRIGELETAHGMISTPFFMPVGTVGSVKSISPNELKEIGANIILCNTYHLYLRPGEQLIKKLGGLHNFIRWDGPILTDSGGYQVFSLSAKNSDQSSVISNQLSVNSDQIKKYNKYQESLVKITEDGVEFKSHLDGSKHLFTPEKVIQIQLDLGVDILMPLDVCLSGKASYEEVKKACEITIEWARRSKLYFDKYQISDIKYQKDKSKINKSDNCELTTNNYLRPLLHGIVQGGLYEDLRKWCAEELIKLDFDGYSVGGLAVDHETRDMWKTVKLMGEILPENKQRYLMGVGTPDDIIKATHLGMDMFDCVLPTRMARHGNIYRKLSQKSKVKSQNCKSKVKADNCKLTTDYYSLVNLLNSRYRTDGGVIDENCGCPACSGGFSKAYISHLIRSNEILGLRLSTLHNLYTYINLMKELRNN